tara:strand:+ start:5145 stop:5921 length:777 start_codon:yes stop_codon:yes gene_type:complete
MIKKVVCGMALLSGLLWGGPSAMADGRVLIMVPQDEELVKVGLDLAVRHPSLLVSYRLGAQQTASLKGWTGTEWVYVSVANFLAGDFFREGPDEAIIVESNLPFPEALIPDASWCERVAKITTDDVRSVVHLAGRALHFEYRDWKWFSERYRLPMAKLNPSQSGIRWYNRRLGDVIGSQMSRNYEDDENWVVLRAPEPAVALEEEVVEPVVVEDEAVEMIDTNVIDVTDVLVEQPINPLEEEPPSAQIVEPVEELPAL